MHYITNLLSRRSFVVLAAALAALLALLLSSSFNSAHSQTTPAATAANQAFSGFHDGRIPMPDSLATIATLNIPTAGSYVINAKLSAHNSSATISSNDARCTLTARADVDTMPFDVESSVGDDDEAVAMQVVHTFATPGTVILRCTDNGNGNVGAHFTKITAVQVAGLSNVGI